MITVIAPHALGSQSSSNEDEEDTQTHNPQPSEELITTLN